MAGILMRCPTMIHEQNVIPGKANVVLAKLVGKVAISFEASRKYFNPSRTVWTGCPCYHHMVAGKTQALAAFDLAGDKKTLVLLGGSQGSQKLNEIFFQLMEDLSAVGFQAIHMTGKKDYPVYAARYAKAHLSVKAYEFINDVGTAYAAADMVIARAGAATVSELGILGLAAVLVPYPFAGNHQKYNAEVLRTNGTAIVIEQKNLTKDSLRQAVENLLTQGTSRENLQMKTKGLFQKDAAFQLALVAEGL
jgi:UDP-N-acetylglucosamine--N-acetylmuramyl-(pentapeptide) pyrophosphoryl-undecaprenol N-acetylglucosamine transferase